MSGARLLLLLASIAAIALAVRSIVIGPVPCDLACALLVGYVAMVLVGVLVPRLEMFGSVTWRGPPGRPFVALTFDDGPDEATTPLVLAELERAGVRATFFV